MSEYLLEKILALKRPSHLESGTVEAHIDDLCDLIETERKRFAVSQLENLKRFSFTTPTDELPMVYVQDIQHQITNLTTKV